MRSAYSKNKRILILSNSLDGIYSFRRQLIVELMDKGYEVFVSAPDGLHRDFFENEHIPHIKTPVNRRSFHIIKDFRLYRSYKKLIQTIKPDIVLTYTIKATIYGNLAAKKCDVPVLSTITGLGSILQNHTLKAQFVKILYKWAFENEPHLFFQNEENLKSFIKWDLIPGEYSLVNGSGVDIGEFQALGYPKESDKLQLLYIGRIMKDKGSRELFSAIQTLFSQGINVHLNVLGYAEKDMYKALKKLKTHHAISFHDEIKDISSFLKKSHALVHPSYHEGMSNVILEAAASGRPVLASNISGCREAVEHGISGFLFDARNEESLRKSILAFSELDMQCREKMGMAGREKIAKEYDRKNVIKSYISAIIRIQNGVEEK